MRIDVCKPTNGSEGEGKQHEGPMIPGCREWDSRAYSFFLVPFFLRRFWIARAAAAVPSAARIAA